MKTAPKNRSANVAGRKWPCASLLLTAAAALAYFFPGLSQALAYESASSLSEPWRLLTCHWVHWSGEHLFWSGAVFLVLSVAIEDIGRRLYATCLLLSALLIPLGLMFATPELATYGGLSGIDSALFGLLAVSIVRESITGHKWTGAIAVGLFSVAFALKIGFEIITGGAVFVNTTEAMVPVPLAHVIGLTIGVGLGLIQTLRDPTSSCHCPRPAAI